MHILKPVLMLAILSSAMLCNNAWSTARPPKVGEQPAEVVKPVPRKPAPDTTRKKPPKRRAVTQIIDAMPATPAASAPRPGGADARPLPLPPVYPPSPMIMNGCDGNGVCSDPSGAHYNGGVGTTLLSPQGRLCNNNGITVQCF